MKPSLKTGASGPSALQRVNEIAEAFQRTQMVEAKRHKDRQTLWRAVGIGGFAIFAVFACLEGLRPAPKPKSPLEAKLLSEQAAAAASETAPAPAVKTAMPEVAVVVPDAASPAVDPTIGPIDKPAVPESVADQLNKEKPLLLTGSDCARDAAVQRDADLLKRTIQAGAWDAYRGLLQKSLTSALTQIPLGQGSNRFDSLWREPVFYQAFLRWKTLSVFSGSELSSHISDLYSGAMISWLLHQDQAMEELLLTIHPKDDGGRVIKFLMDAWAVNEERYEKYFPLAVACAVVFDEPMNIPNPIGNKEYGAEEVVDPMKRYLWYVEKNEKGKLAAPVHHSTARDLVWAVCAPVTTSELEWSIDKMHFRRKNWGDAYGRVEYLMERAVEGLNPYKEYSFAEILKEGGICGDQSYFCVNTARAQGIPAMIIGGETDLGGHAWAGLKHESDEWTTGVGRIGGASKGQADNPQTRASITEQEILQWNDRHHQSPAYTLAVWRHLWLADYYSAAGEDESNAATIRLANQLGQSFTETWQALYSSLEKQMQLTGEPAIPNNLEEWKSFAKSMRQQFKDNPRMAQLAANAEMEYIFPYGEEGDAKRLLMRERRRIERDSGEQTDLIASSLKREADLLHKRGGPDAKRDISRLYDRALRDYGGSITGFKMMAEDYFGFLKDDPELSRKAARDIELAFKRVVETGTKDWFRAQTETSIYKMICGYYRSAGDDERALMLEKRYEVLMRRAKRSAL